MEQSKYREKVLIGIDCAPPSFDIRDKVMGPNGANLRYIANETGASVTIRGKGSGFIEPNTGQESPEPIHISVEHSKYEVLQACRQLAFNLIETVQQEWRYFQQQQQQQSEPQQNFVQTIPISSELEASAAAGTNGKLVASGGGLQLQLPLYNPPPSLVVPPLPIHISQSPIQMSVGTTQTSQSQMTGGASEGNLVSLTAGNQPTQQQTPAPTADLQLQTQQIYVSQGGGMFQPATIIPQQQLLAATQQPQIISQASYPVQYMQASNGQIIAYSNVGRQIAGTTTAQQQPQVMLVQYTPQRPSVVQGRTATQNTIPQIVQILNPQTGQYQHVLQHVQPQIQMQQFTLGQGVGNNMMGGGVLMPVQQQQQQGQQQLVQQAIQFAQPGIGTPAQGMIITTQQPSNQQQITLSHATLQLQQQDEKSSPASQQQARPHQGTKRKFESEPPIPPPTLQSILPTPQSISSHATLQTTKKGVGSETVHHIVKQPSQQQQQQAPPSHQQHFILQHQQQQQWFGQQQQQQQPLTQQQLLQFAQQQILVHHHQQQQQHQQQPPPPPPPPPPPQQQQQVQVEETQQDLEKPPPQQVTKVEPDLEHAKRGKLTQNAEDGEMTKDAKMGTGDPGKGYSGSVPGPAAEGYQQQGGYPHQPQQQAPPAPNFPVYNAPPPFHSHSHPYPTWAIPQ